MHMVSLESPAGGDEEGGVELKDTLEDGRAQPDEVFVNDMVRQNIQEVMRELNPREAEILSLRLGLNGKAETTLEEIGAMFNLTRERVRQIEVDAAQLSHSQFVERFLAPNLPVLLKGAASHWRASSEWVDPCGQPDLQALLAAAGPSATVTVTDCLQPGSQPQCLTCSLA
ncbi:RNA_pol_sigma70 domain-containing protein, partial [Haematococcus lacustris]